MAEGLQGYLGLHALLCHTLSDPQVKGTDYEPQELSFRVIFDHRFFY